MFRFYLRNLFETFIFMIKTHTKSREIDFYYVAAAACISNFLSKQVHFFVGQIPYSTLVEGATHFEQDRVDVNVRLAFLCSQLKSRLDFRLRYVFLTFQFVKVTSDVVPSKKAKVPYLEAVLQIGRSLVRSQLVSLEFFIDIISF